MHWEPFKASDLMLIELQAAQAEFASLRTDPQYAASLEKAGQAVSLWEGERVLFAGGISPIWEGRSMVWSLISKDAGRHFVRVFRGIERFLELHPVKRVEAFVDSDFTQGHRLMRLLGFEREGTMRAWREGRDCDLYAKVMP